MTSHARNTLKLIVLTALLAYATKVVVDANLTITPRPIPERNDANLNACQHHQTLPAEQCCLDLNPLIDLQKKRLASAQSENNLFDIQRAMFKLDLYQTLANDNLCFAN